MIEKLKPCPFCGGNVKLEITILDTTIICQKCRLFMVRRSNKEAEAKVKKVWNTRFSEREIK